MIRLASGVDVPVFYTANKPDPAYFVGLALIADAVNGSALSFSDGVAWVSVGGAGGGAQFVTTTYSTTLADTLAPGFTCPASQRAYDATYENLLTLRNQYDMAKSQSLANVDVRLLNSSSVTTITRAQLLADIIELSQNFYNAFTYDY
jgi:hypothetical protein